jgi:urease accessory protein
MRERAKTPRAKLPGVARIGIGGPVGSGKTALIERLIPVMKARNLEIGVVANDIVTQEDAERIRRSGLIDPARVMAVETGACPHTAIREDPTLNIQAVETLVHTFPALDAVLVESGGDNLASTFSFELVDYWLFVIDTAGGDDIPRKRGTRHPQVGPAGHQQDRSCAFRRREYRSHGEAGE